jgi:hypothetical protein
MEGTSLPLFKGLKTNPSHFGLCNLSLRPVRHCPRQASQLKSSGRYVPLSVMAWTMSHRTEGQNHGYVYKILKLVLITDKVPNKLILFRPFISPLCRKAPKAYIDLIIYWY